MRRSELTLLLELLKQPTAPFREQRVVDFAIGWLRRQNIPHFRDPIGNIVVGCASRDEYRRLLDARTAEPVRLFIAHVDHPGFHGERWRGARLRVRWHGGGPVRRLNGARVWLAGSDGELHEGRMHAARLAPSGRRLATAEIRTAAWRNGKRPPAATLYGGLRFRAPVWRSGSRLYAQAADDLVGVFAILATARRLRNSRRTAPFVGLLTRAEEVGFIGAIGHLQLGWLARAKRPLVAVSLETSRTLPGARIGGGPVVRLGDRRTVFDAPALNVLAQVAARALPGRHQRRIMDGGTCEATAATVYGLPAIGISVPLGNYHNQSLEGGPDSRGPDGPAPEFVHLDDVDGLLALCRGLLRPGLSWSDPWHQERKAFAKRYRALTPLLRPPLAKQIPKSGKRRTAATARRK